MTWFLFLTDLIQVLILIGILGLVSYQLRYSGLKWAWMLIGIISLFPFLYLFRLNFAFAVTLWLGICGIFIISYIKPILIPLRLWNRVFSLIYFSLINFLMVLWSFCTNQPINYIWLVGISFLSGCLGITRIMFYRR